MKSTSARRTRSGRAGRGSSVPRVMIAGLLIIVAGGAALFWPRGGSIPTGIGENQTVVSAPVEPLDLGDIPHSGDVDINDAAPPALTPEPVGGETTAASEAQSPTQTLAPKEANPNPVALKINPNNPHREQPPAEEPAARKSNTPATDLPLVAPQSSGPYAVQVGAFGLSENADMEAARLKALGWDARVRGGNSSSGEMVFRVWIGYFASREEAQIFINQNNRRIGGAIPVHR